MPELVAERNRYTDEDIARGLTEVARWAGNILAATESLAKQGHSIPRQTLDGWVRTTHADRYQAIRRDHMPKVHDTMASLAEDRYIREAQLEAKLEDQVEATIHDLKPGEASGALRNMTVSKKLNFDIATLSRGRPTQIVEQRNPEQILKQLAQRYGGAIDSTAVETKAALSALERQATSADTGQQRAEQRTQ